MIGGKGQCLWDLDGPGFSNVPRYHPNPSHRFPLSTRSLWMPNTETASEAIHTLRIKSGTPDRGYVVT